MVSFFRRKKPQDAASAQDGSTRRYSVEELAAAFPEARPVTSDAADAAAALEQAREVADILQAAEPAPAPATPEPQRFAPAAPALPDVVVPGPSPRQLIDTPVPAAPVADAPVVVANPPAVAPAPAPAAAAPIAPPPVEAPVPAPDTAPRPTSCLLYTSYAADEEGRVYSAARRLH
ncbi:hypothetical protein [Pseudoxanthomonas winnipegensis]|uniref:hypothetical protein n=1 Tax=Pseudoxanthomonas winnipegensis TaxID=2480810 RepID=UPI001040CF6E|nr:hypothetical protein [Pseudoxanthomonas winnipegensis]TBV75171.1 hypothetical protein EYC45_07965 [Pseudoxanthomonas winnipegensis]